MPLLGLGVYQNNDCFPAVLAALKHGYRHIDSARVYRNEAEVGRAVRESGVPRTEVFVSECLRLELRISLNESSRWYQHPRYIMLSTATTAH